MLGPATGFEKTSCRTWDTVSQGDCCCAGVAGAMCCAVKGSDSISGLGMDDFKDMDT